MDMQLLTKWYDDGLQLAKWSNSSKKVLSSAFFELREILLRNLTPYCMHLKGRGGVKGSVRLLQRKIKEYPFTARFDVKSFYGSISHKTLFNQLVKLNINPELMRIVKDYVTIPDTENKSMGIVAGGALSMLLGAVYLAPLDAEMNYLYKKGDIFYLHYVDDIVILAKTRWKLRTAIKLMYKTLETLKLQVHYHEKRFIGKTQEGFSFLGYFFKKGRKLRPSKESLNRFARRAGQLIEQGSCVNILLSYARRYFSYIHAGLKFSVTLQNLRKYIKLFDHNFDSYLSAKIILY